MIIKITEAWIDIMSGQMLVDIAGSIRYVLLHALREGLTCLTYVKLVTVLTVNLIYNVLFVTLRFSGTNTKSWSA